MIAYHLLVRVPTYTMRPHQYQPSINRRCTGMVSKNCRVRLLKSETNIFKDATSLGLELGYDLDSIVNNQTKSHIIQIYMDDEHFIQEFLERHPSGRLRHPKYRTAWGKDCASILINLFSNNYFCMQGYLTPIFYQAEYEYQQYFSRNFYS